MAASMRFICRKAPPMFTLLLEPRLLTRFQIAKQEYLPLDLCTRQKLTRNLSTMQSMRIPAQKVYRPHSKDSSDEFPVNMYKLKKNLELRRYIPIVPFIRTCGIVEVRGEPISNSDGSELLSMTGEVLNVRKSRRRRVTKVTWDLLKSCEGYIMDLSNYTKYLMVCKENELSIDVTTLQEEMRRAGICPDQEFYEELVGYYSAHGQLDRVRRLLDKMRSDNFSVTAKTFSNYIWAAFNAGHEEEMASIFKSMGSCGTAPDLNCYMTLMKCYAVKGDLPKITELIKRAEVEAGMRQIHQIQLLLPLLQNDHRSQADQVFDGLCIENDVTKTDMGEIEYYGNQLVVNLFINDGFNVFNLSGNTAVFFIRSYARGPGVDSKIYVQGARKVSRLAAKLTVQMLNNNKVSLDRMMLEATAISKEYMTCIVLELKGQCILESYQEFCSMIENGPCSSYLNNQSKKILQEIAKASFDGEKQPVSSSEITITDHTSKSYPMNALNPEVLEALDNKNDDKALQEFNKMKRQKDNVGLSIAANMLRVKYMERQKFDKALYYQNEMIRANPSFRYIFFRVAYLAMKMLNSGEHEGIVQSVNDYLDIAMEMGSKMAEIQHKDLQSLMKILTAFLEPVEVLQILQRLRSHDKFLVLESKAFLRQYLNRDAKLAVQALAELTKLSQRVDIEFLKVMLKVARDNDRDLITEAYRIVEGREGEPSANVLQVCAYLMNDQVQEARQLSQTTVFSGSIRYAHVKACLLHLQNKPDMLNAFVELKDSEMLRRILGEVLNRADVAGSSFAQKIKKNITQYMNENPDSALTVMCSDMMAADQMELEKLRFKMMKKSEESNR
ncbi:uncharacterized protein LOC117329434 [Pecten maximus]|uniref:uncharacterized protein LOC117329434 n=1 Tax=Pecten maximus TaxID=6579 RepID=UPI0014582D95|nr:uncharacterized protein LOC117329434 [Pecten maximus]